MKLFSYVSVAGLICGLCLSSPAHGQGTETRLFHAHGQGPARHSSSGEVPALPVLAGGAAQPDYGIVGEARPLFLPGMPYEGMNVEELTCPQLMEKTPPFESMSNFSQSGGIINSLDYQISQMPPIFVHARQTVRVSERTAEIWVKLPRDSQSSVSVNFVEYPPEGDFRIFRTRITTNNPQRFYLSAKRWDVPANRWIDLVTTQPLLNDGIPNFDYLVLQPGSREIVQFDNSQPPSLTSAFLFHPDEQQIVGTATLIDNRITSINWQSPPEKLNISMVLTSARLNALPLRPFEARITFTIQDSAKRTVATLKPIRVTFSGSNDIQGEINFMGPQLQDALVSNGAPAGSYRLKAKMEFVREIGDAGYINVSGNLGNDIELTINR